MFKIEKANAYSALVGAVAGTLGTIVVAAFFLGGQWERWVEIRDAHKLGNVVNEEVNLTSFAKSTDIPDTSVFARKSDIPDTSEFVRQAELPQSPDLSDFVRASSLPKFDDFAMKSELPSLAGYARASEIPDVSGLLKSSTYNAFVQNLGRGKTLHPRDGATTSSLCAEGYSMVGVKYTVASGDNAGALYHGLYPVCRKLTR